MSVSGTWKSGTLKGQLGGQWKTLVVSTGSGNQDIGYGEFYQEDSDSVSFQIQWLDIAKVKVIKEDKETGVNLEGAVFGLYSDKACTKLITKMPATDRKGASEVELVKTQDVIYLKEISVPSGYKLNTSSFQVELKVNNTTTVTVTNEEQKGKILIRKQGNSSPVCPEQTATGRFLMKILPFPGQNIKFMQQRIFTARISRQRSMEQGTWWIHWKPEQMVLVRQNFCT